MIKDIIEISALKLSEEQKAKLLALEKMINDKPKMWFNHINEPETYKIRIIKTQKNGDWCAFTQAYNQKQKNMPKSKCGKDKEITCEQKFKELEQKLSELLKKDLTIENISEINNLHVKLTLLEDEIEGKYKNKKYVVDKNLKVF